jgi:tetratricopeptide (TPR) repeat protein
VDDPRLAREVVQRQVTILGKQGKVAEARKLIRNLTDQQADDRTKVLLETLLLREVRNWAEAHKVLHAANQRIPNDIELLYEQAMVEDKLNKLADMERLLRRVIDLKPDHYNALNALGYTLADRKMRLPEAKTLIKRALDLAPGDPFITDSMGWVEYRLGNHKEALRLLRAAYKARPDAEISAHLGEVLWVSGQRDEALHIWREGLKRDASNEVLKETLQRLKAKP